MKPWWTLGLVIFLGLGFPLRQAEAQDLTSQLMSGSAAFPVGQEDYDFSLGEALPYLLKNSVSKNLSQEQLSPEQQRAADRKLAASLDPNQIPAVALAKRTLSQPTKAKLNLAQAPAERSSGGSFANKTAASAADKASAPVPTAKVPTVAQGPANPLLTAQKNSPNFPATATNPEAPAAPVQKDAETEAFSPQSNPKKQADYGQAGYGPAQAGAISQDAGLPPANLKNDLGRQTVPAQPASKESSAALNSQAVPVPNQAVNPAANQGGDPATNLTTNPALNPAANTAASPPAEEKVFKQNVRPIKPAIQIAGPSNPNPVQPVNHGSAVISLKSEASTNKTRFSLADIADIQANSEGLKNRLENFALGQIELGQEGLNISAKEVEEKLLYGFPQVQFSIKGKGSSLSYVALVLSVEEQKALVADYIEKNDPAFKDFGIEYLSPLSNIALPSLEPSYKLEAFGPSLKTSRFQNWKLSLYSQQVLFKQVWLRGRLRPPENKAAVAKLENPASKNASLGQQTGQQVGPPPNQPEDRFDRFFKQQQSEETEAANPKQATKPANQNSIFIFKSSNTSDGDGKLMVEKNKPIELVYQGSKIELKVRAIALDAGNLGDFIRVKNLQSDSVVMARILSPLQVLINE